MAGTLLSPPRHSFFSDPPPFSKFETENCTPPPNRRGGVGGGGADTVCSSLYLFKSGDHSSSIWKRLLGLDFQKAVYQTFLHYLITSYNLYVHRSKFKAYQTGKIENNWKLSIVEMP